MKIWILLDYLSLCAHEAFGMDPTHFINEASQVYTDPSHSNNILQGIFSSTVGAFSGYKNIQNM